MITKEDFNNFIIDIKDLGFNVYFGDFDRPNFHFWIEKPRIGDRRREVYFSIEEYSNLLENIEEIFDRLEEEYKFKYMNIYFSWNKMPDLKINILPESKELLSKILHHYDKNIQADNIIYNLDGKIFSHMHFYFDSLIYHKKQDNSNIKYMYDQLEDEKTRKMLRDFYPDLLKESRIKKFKDI